MCTLFVFLFGRFKLLCLCCLSRRRHSSLDVSDLVWRCLLRRCLRLVLYAFRISKGLLKSRIKGHIMIAVGINEVIIIQQNDCPAVVNLPRRVTSEILVPFDLPALLHCTSRPAPFAVSTKDVRVAMTR